MADYYPLISRAVAGLEKNNGENRRALYERARAALLAQLRGVTPSLNESDITRERLALEESIRKVEAELARQFVDPSRQPPAPKIRPIEPRPVETRPPEPRPVGRRRAVGPAAAALRQSAVPHAAGGAAGRAPQNAAVGAAAAAGRAPVRHDLRPAAVIRAAARRCHRRRPAIRCAARAGERRSLSDAGLKDFRNVVSEADELGGASARAERSARDAYAAVPAPAPEIARSPERPARAYERAQFDRSEPRMFEPQAPQERMFEQQDEPHPHEDFSEPMLESSFAVDDSRPVASKARRGPPPIEDELDYEQEEEEARPRRSYRDLIVKGAVALGIIVGIVAVGWALVWQWPNMVGLYRAFRAPATEVARDTSTPATPKKTQERVEPGSQQSPATPSGQPGAAVAQKVVLYEEDPADPNGKRFVGSAIWRTETVTPGPGQAPDLAIRADVEVPERKLTMTWLLRRNTDKGLPATHTVEIMFKLPADFPAGGISNVPGILMKQAEQTRGVPLAGSAVKVTNGFYLIGLSNSDENKERNLQLLKDRAWFDIPVVYNNNRRAILAMEKGTPGERVFADAFKAWKQ